MSCLVGVEAFSIPQGTERRSLDFLWQLIALMFDKRASLCSSNSERLLSVKSIVSLSIHFLQIQPLPSYTTIIMSSTSVCTQSVCSFSLSSLLKATEQFIIQLPWYTLRAGLKGTKGGVNAILFSQDGKLLLSGGTRTIIHSILSTDKNLSR